MKKQLTKALSIILTVMLLVGIAPVSVMTAFAADVKEAAPEVKEKVTEGAKELYSETKAAVSDTVDKVAAASETITSGDFRYVVLDDGTAEIKEYVGRSPDVVIPDTIDGYKVTSIGYHAFYRCNGFNYTKVDNVTLPNGLISIGEGAFGKCWELRDIEIPNSVTTIGKGAFHESNLISVNIPNSVTTIGEEAFKGCGLLTSVTLSNNIESIEYGTFASCKALENITIPDSVTSIGNNAFDWCSSLKNVTIPDSVTSIGGAAFAQCSSLDNVIIPDSVTYLGGAAFVNCSSLENIKLSNGITTLRDETFAGCKSLENIVIPNSVTYMAMYVFLDCKSLENIEIPVSLKAIEWCSFQGCDKLENVYYNGSKEQWSGIRINGGNDYLANANIYYFSDMESATVDVSESLDPDSVTFKIYNRESEGSHSLGKLKDVTVKMGSYENTFDKSIALSNDLEWTSAVFSKDEFYDYIVPKKVMDSYLMYKRGESIKAYMSRDRKDDKPYISTAFAWEPFSPHPYTEIRTSKFTIEPGTPYDIILTASGGDDFTYYIWQDGASVLTSETGEFTSAFNGFSSYKPIYAYVKDSSGRTSKPVELKLDISTFGFPDGEVSLLGKDFLKYTFNDDIPILGGMEVSMEGFKFPVGFEVEGNRLRMSLGLNIFSYDSEDVDEDKGENGHHTIGDGKRWEKFKKEVSGATKESGKDDFTKYKNLKEAISPDNVFKKKNWKSEFDTNLIGYIEGYIVRDNNFNQGIILTDIGGGLALKFVTKYTAQFMTTLGLAYVSFDAGASGSGEIKGARCIPNSDIPLDFDTFIKAEGMAKLGGGLGHKGTASLGAYGKATLPLDWSLVQKHFDLGLKGELGIEGEVGPFKAEKTVFSGGPVSMLNFYYGKKSMMLLPDRFQNNSIKNNINISGKTESEEIPEVMPRDYLKETSAWLGGSKKRLRSVMAVSDGLEVRELQTNVFKNAEIQTVTLDDGRMISAWITDNSNRSDINRLQLVYSVYENDVWSAPKAVADDGTNDMSPALATDGKNVFVVWQNIKKQLGDNDTPAILFANSEINLAKYNSEKDTFEDVKTLSNNVSYDYCPVLAVENGSPVVYWIKNGSNDLSKADGYTVYRYANGKTSAVINNSNYILDMACAFVDGKDEISFSTDVDGDLSTTKDIKVFTLSNGSKIQRTPADEKFETADTNVAYGKLDGKTTLFFSDDKDIYCVQNGEAKGVLIGEGRCASNLQVLNDGAKTTLLWTEATEIGNEIWTCTYENGVWSEPVQLSKIGALLGDISAVYNNGQIKGVLSRTKRVKQSDGSYKNGQTDLCFMQLNDFTDLEASFIEFTEAEFVKGQTAKIPVYLKNNGTKQIDKVNVKITDRSGTNVTTEYEVLLASGEGKYIDVDYTVPANYYRGDLKIEVTPVGSVDMNTADNSDSKDIGYADISIGEITVEDLENYYVLSATLSNDNQTVANNVQVVVRSGSEDGEALDTVDIGSLQIGEQRSITYVVNKETAKNVENGIGKIYFTATTDNEKMTDDNSSGAAFEIGEAAPPCEHVSGEWEVVKEPTEAETGLKQRKCSVCGEVIEEAVIPALGKKVDSGYCGATTKWSFYDSGVLKISGTGIVKHYAKPAAVPWNKYAEQIKSVYVGDGITRIGEFAFYGCKNLESVTIANSVKEISGYVFKNCANLKEITLPKNLEKIGDSAFYGTGLAKIKIPATVKSVGYYAFSRCYSLKNIEFLGNAPVFYSNAFNKVVATVNYPANNSTWTAAKKQHYGGTLKWVQAGLVDEGLCGSTTSWKLSADGTLTISGTGIVKNYSSYTLVPWLKYADRIKRVVVEEGITRIGEFAFYGCTNLTSVTLPSSLKEINGYVFKKCSSLTQITLPGGLTKIGDSAFYGTGLKKLTIPATVKYVGWYAFSRCASLTEIEFLGSAPELPGKAFNMVTATVYYPSGNSSWNNVAWNKLGGTITHKAK